MRRRAVWLASLLLVMGGLLAWLLFPIEHIAHGKSQQSMRIDVDFARFRQIMVRKNATKAIVEHGGLQLLDDRLTGVDVELASQRRPLLNALRGTSASELGASRSLTVSLTDPYLDAEQLELLQQVAIEPDLLQVETRSRQAAGKLDSYRTTLTATPSSADSSAAESASANSKSADSKSANSKSADSKSADNADADRLAAEASLDAAETTSVELTVDLSIRTRVPRIFVSQADRRVQAASESAVEQQAAAIEAFIDRFADRILILPELGQ